MWKVRYNWHETGFTANIKMQQAISNFWCFFFVRAFSSWRNWHKYDFVCLNCCFYLIFALSSAGLICEWKSLELYMLKYALFIIYLYISYMCIWFLSNWKSVFVRRNSHIVSVHAYGHNKFVFSVRISVFERRESVFCLFLSFSLFSFLYCFTGAHE